MGSLIAFSLAVFFFLIGGGLIGGTVAGRLALDRWVAVLALALLGGSMMLLGIAGFFQTKSLWAVAGGLIAALILVPVFATDRHMKRIIA